MEEWSGTIGDLLAERLATCMYEKSVQTDLAQVMRVRSASPGNLFRLERESRPSDSRNIELVHPSASKGDEDGLSERDSSLSSTANLLTYAAKVLQTEPARSPVYSTHAVPLIMKNKAFAGKVDLRDAKKTVKETLVTGSGGYFELERSPVRSFAATVHHRNKRLLHTRIPAPRPPKSPAHSPPSIPRSYKPISPNRSVAAPHSPKEVRIDLSFFHNSQHSEKWFTEPERPIPAPMPYPKSSIDCQPRVSGELETCEKAAQICELSFERRHWKERERELGKRRKQRNVDRKESALSLSSLTGSQSCPRLYTNTYA